MRPTAAAIAAYVATLLIAVAAAIAHPWSGVEAHFVKAVAGLSSSVADLASPSAAP